MRQLSAATAARCSLCRKKRNGILTHRFWSLLLSVGPFALPLVWWHPRLSTGAKIVITVIALAVTYALSILLIKSINSVTAYYSLLSKW